MTGRYEIILTERNHNLTYRLVLDRQVTILKGNSGTGKSTLYNLALKLRKTKGADNSLHCNLLDKLTFLEAEDWDEQIKKRHNRIFLVDEFESRTVASKAFAEAVTHSDNYFLIISRSGCLNYLTYSVNSVYELQATKTGKETIDSFVSRYVNTSQSIKPDYVVTEDEKAGYQMYANILNCPVVSAKGKDKVFDTVKPLLDSGNTVFVIADGAAFGAGITRLFPMFSGKDLFVFTPECFEWLVLTYSKFKHLLDEGFYEPWNYCDTKKYISYEPYYYDILKRLCAGLNMKYDKSNLPSGLNSASMQSHIKSCLSDLDRSCFKEG